MYKKIVFSLTVMMLFVICAIVVVLAYNFADSLNGLNGQSGTNGASQNIATPIRHYSLVPVNDVAVLQGHEVNVRDFLVHVESSNGIIDVQILYPPVIDWNDLGRHEVVINVAENGISAREIVAIYILEPLESIRLEAGSSVDEISPLDFVADVHLIDGWTHFNVDFLTDLEGFTDEVGQREVALIFNGVVFNAIVDIVDSTPPVVSLTDVTVRMGREVSPWDFITEVFDISPPVLAYFSGVVDTDTEGSHPVFIAVWDYFGNTAHHMATLTVLPNAEPPVIIGAVDIDVMIGSSVMFRQGVSAEDAFGTPLELHVDSSLVNVHEFGSYPVIYSAVDAGGLRTEVTVYVRVIDVDTHEVRERAQEVLDRILRDDMTQVEEARAIFDWITANVGYAAGFEPRSVYEGAHQALVHRRGDCFTFYSVSEVLLTMAGVPNRRVDRYGGQNRHVWNLINPDELGWHHFDTTPIRVRTIDRFMFTDSQAQRFSEIIRIETLERNYFTFDTSLHPEVVY